MPGSFEVAKIMDINEETGTSRKAIDGKEILGSFTGSPDAWTYASVFQDFIWLWINTYRFIFNGMNIHLPATLMFTRGIEF